MEKELLEKGYRKYEGDKIDVFYHIDVCEHAAKCVHGSPSVFNTHKKPWICLKDANEEEVKATIDKCPSGALKYLVKE